MTEQMEITTRTTTSKGDRWQYHWEKYLKKIPKQGLNNLTKEPHYALALNTKLQAFRKKWTINNEWKGEPTIKRRLDRICIGGLFGNVSLPFYAYVGSMLSSGTGEENLPEIKELTKQILMRLEELYDKMDTVQVMLPEEVDYWKRKLRATIHYIREQSSQIGMKMIQEAEFIVIDQIQLLGSKEVE